jgi:hypothetical protein
MLIKKKLIKSMSIKLAGDINKKRGQNTLFFSSVPPPDERCNRN